MKLPVAKVVYWWDWSREQFWFVPLAYAAASIIVALITLQLDDHWIASGDGVGPNVAGIDIETTADSARVVLGSIIGGLVTVFGLTVSITMLSVSQTSSQYGPRLVRSVTNAAVTQNVVGLMIGTILFATIVLRSIRNGEAGEVFVPNLSVLTVEVGASICLLALLAHTSHVMRCMRAESLIQTIYEEVRRAMEAYFESDDSTDADGEEHAEDRDVDESDRQSEKDDWLSEFSRQHHESDSDSDSGCYPVRAQQAGYLQAVDLSELVKQTAEHNARVDVIARPGHFIQHHDVLAKVGLDVNDDSERDSILSIYRKQFLIGTSRTPRQDLEAGMLELVEVAVRALSPGVNDPFTAINAVDFLSALLRQAAGSPARQSVHFDDGGKARVRLRPTCFVDLLDTTFDPLRQHASESVPVLCRLLEALESIADSVHRKEDVEAIQKQAECIERRLADGGQDEYDLDDLRARLDSLAEKIDKRNANDGTTHDQERAVG